MSTILSADDLNDFIAPGAACIKPVEVEKTRETAEIQIGPDGMPLEAIDNEVRDLKAASISLTDCLACSGCITSSETVLVELQSPKELRRVLEDRSKVFVVSVSPQVRASLANAFGLTIPQVDARLTHLFIDMLGFKYAVGTEIGRIVSLETSRREVEERGGAGASGPVISSVCPGWAIYAEKTHPHVLKYLSNVKSPQQITGHLLKKYTAAQAGVPLENVYHVSVMPCFDKKLESVRPDNVVEESIQEVDLVITGKEIVQMLEETHSVSFDALPQNTNYTTPQPFELSWRINPGSSSGGYLWYILESVKARYPGSEIERKVGKNSDVVEFNVVSGGQVVWRGAQIYGFRNIQNIVRKLNPGKRVVSKRATDPLSYGYIEIMACPGGCTNGGGQLGATAGVTPKSWHHAVEELYQQIPYVDMAEVSGIEDVPTYTEFKAALPPQNVPEALVVGSQW